MAARWAVQELALTNKPQAQNRHAPAILDRDLPVQLRTETPPSKVCHGGALNVLDAAGGLAASQVDLSYNQSPAAHRAPSYCRKPSKY
jgi:hypothetical protein